MRKLFLLTALQFVIHSLVYSQQTDSVSVSHYDIHLSVRNFSQKSINGYTLLSIVPKYNNISGVKIDLLGLSISEVSIKNVSQNYSRNDSEVFVRLDKLYGKTDTIQLKIAYSGQPKSDPKWGGFYFQGDYAYNMGVGFVLNPHNLGRCWYPCLDNFTNRAAYDFYINTDSSYMAVCNGILKDSITQPDNSVIWHWQMPDPIPTYLSCVAVSKYQISKTVFQGINKSFRIELAAIASDTQRLKNSMVNLPNAIQRFEDCYGPYRFSKAGYVLVPFTSGAMEHATCISYPNVYADGSTNNDDLMAHELAHSWWGNIATCASAKEMWLNEGWASYSERVFAEKMISKLQYTNSLKSNLLQVLRYAHLRDAGFRAISDIPHEFTYGDHVYKKSANVIHSLRSYIGDSAFFKACKRYMNQYAFATATSANLESAFKMEADSNLVKQFFSNWIYDKGFAAFKIRKLQTEKIGLQYKTTLTIEQQLRTASGFYKNVPMQVLFKDSFNSVIKNITISGNQPIEEYLVYSDFAPGLAILNPSDMLSLAITSDTLTINSISSAIILPNSLLTITSTNVPIANNFLRVEHFWTRADQTACKIPGMYVSNYRYWNVSGTLKPGFKATAFFNYDASTPSTNNSGWLDHTLINSEDSVFLLYRPDALSDWQLVPDSILVKQMGPSTSDKIGRFWLKDFKLGEYTLGCRNSALAATTNTKSTQREMKIYPNPTHDILYVTTNFFHSAASIEIHDASGKKIFQTPMADIETTLAIPTHELSEGIYFVKYNDNTSNHTKRVYIKH